MRRLTTVRSRMMAFPIRGCQDWRDPADAADPPAPGRGHAQRPARLRRLRREHAHLPGLTMPCPRGWVMEHQLPSLPQQVQAQCPATADGVPVDQPSNAPIRFNPRVATSTLFTRHPLPNPHHCRDPGPAPGRAVHKRCTVIRPERPTTATHQGRPPPSASQCDILSSNIRDPCRRSESGIDEVALQRAVGRHWPRQRQTPFPLEPPQRVAHPHQERAQLPRRQLRTLAQGAPTHRQIPVAKAPIADLAALAYDSAPYRSRPEVSLNEAPAAAMPTAAA